MAEQHPFTWRHFQSEIMFLGVRWYVRYALSYRDLEEMMRERGLSVDHTTIFRWVQHYAPELEQRCRPHLKACKDPWKGDETSINIRKTWFSLYRAVDSAGNTLEFLLRPTRDAEAATDFFLKALRSTADGVPQSHPIEEQIAQPETAANPATAIPRVINVDKNAASPKAVADLKTAGALPEHVALRQVTYRNNLIEQDHRFIQPFPNG
jgi:IS6 family transposase